VRFLRRDKLEEAMITEHEKVLKTSLEDFLKEARDIGYSYFFKDIIKKVIIARLQKKGLLYDDYDNT
jgi:hypothetical protein